MEDKVVPFPAKEYSYETLQEIIDREVASGYKYVNHEFSDKLTP